MTDFERLRRVYDQGPDASWDDVFGVLRETYTADEVPPCRVCGAELTIVSMGGGRATEYSCGAIEPISTPWNSPEWKHYEKSKWTQYRSGDSLVLRVVDALEARLANEDPD